MRVFCKGLGRGSSARQTCMLPFEISMCPLKRNPSLSSVECFLWEVMDFYQERGSLLDTVTQSNDRTELENSFLLRAPENTQCPFLKPRPLFQHLTCCEFPSVLCVSFFFCLFAFSRAAPVAYGGSQARGLMGAVATSLCQSHSNTESKPHLQPTPQLTATPDP